MEEFLDIMMHIAPFLSILEILGVVFSLLYMHYTAKYRNYTLSAAWYICGVFFGLITLIVFLVKKKDFPGPNAKVCLQCGNQLPESYQVCPRCMMELPPVDEQAKEKDRKYSKGFGIAVAVIFAVSIIAGTVIGALAGIAAVEDFEYYFDDDYLYDVNYRIDVDGVFYDQKGNSYEAEDDVLLYDEQGRVYTYVEEEYYDEDNYCHYEEFYVRDDGEKYFAYDCYVNEDGWFYCDKGGLLEMYSVDTSSMTQEELDAYYNELLEAEDHEYKYYDYPYVDADGTFYYCAYEASWNAQGELITAENDYVTKVL